MKNFFSPAVIAAAVIIASCDGISPQQAEGELRWHFSQAALLQTRSGWNLPDTNDFILNVKSSSGTLVYDGPYGKSPESMMVRPGEYEVVAVSNDFDPPMFDTPQFGDRQIVVVEEGRRTDAVLQCRQVNSGIRLSIDPDFGNVYPKGELFVGSDDGRLLYEREEKRTAFFNPGPVSIIFRDAGAEKTIFTRNLIAQEILTVRVSAPETGSALSGGDVSIIVDTTRIWSNDDASIGDDTPGKGSDEAVNVSQAITLVGHKEVWVKGYIVGGDLTSGKGGISFKPPFASSSNLAIAARSSVSDKSSCMSVQLSKGDIRTAINLPDHPDLVGRMVRLKGDIVKAYYGIPGIKNITDYELDQ